MTQVRGETQDFARLSRGQMPISSYFMPAVIYPRVNNSRESIQLSIGLSQRRRTREHIHVLQELSTFFSFDTVLVYKLTRH